MDMVLEFVYLEEMLKGITIPRKSSTNNRRGFPEKHRAITLGETTGRFNGLTGLSYYSHKYPALWQEIQRIGTLIVPFTWKSCHLNNNVVCPPHRDTGNATLSCIISFGDYTGADLMVEGVKQQTYYTPCIFNGAEKLHWNEDTLVGNKYSLVFF
jgi:hypothetical protein